ncbi:non-ribosomal peptide synthetase, partial [Dactylosporangium darangshiense]|uniref:non-ribosomal peptide synthetase n=1 Tax=Dactylosporangium darangshiense TaxID=579108 RepID=UPI0031EE7A52
PAITTTDTLTTITTRPPIGRPLPNIGAILLDQHLNPAPDGTTAELHIGGPGLAHGYHHRPALTAERFIPNPHTTDGSRLYRTGDLARRQPNGELDHLGRTDHQIKLRGHRIEPAEIETALTTHPNITTAIITANHNTLTAYLTTTTNNPPTTDELRTHLHHTLPDHMIPTHYIHLTTLPRTPNGKIDRNALPTPDTTRPDLTTTYQPPTTPTEQHLTTIWTDLLDLDHIGIGDDFFNLGGHSLLA